MTGIIKLAIAVSIFIVTYFFSSQLQRVILSLVQKFGKRVGVFSTSKEYAIQRYMFLHRGSLVAKIYDWVNEQIINLGLKRYGITPVGYICFWSLVCIPLTLAIGILLSVSVFSFVGLYFMLFFAVLLLTRVYVADKMEKREAMIMNAEDLIIPDIRNGVQNSIMRYKNNFAPEIRPEFEAFLDNITGRGHSFASAMYMLSDALGSMFREFAQKAIFYENLGEDDMVDIFQDIVETNRQRRDLRYDNNKIFNELRVTFMVSASLTSVYGVFIMTTDAFSRYFFLETAFGRMLLVLMMFVVIGVLSYNTTIKSKVI